MSRSSDRGLVEPLPALVAVVVVSAALSLYVGVLDDALPASRERHTASHAVDRIEANCSTAGVVHPDRLSNGLDALPTGYEANATLRTDDDRWSAGPSAPDGADTATRFVSVDAGPNTISPGRLTVVVWR